MRFPGPKVRLVEITNAQRILFRRPEGKKQFWFNGEFFFFNTSTNIRVREINFILSNNTTDFTALIFTKLTITQQISVAISCTENVQTGQKSVEI